MKQVAFLVVALSTGAFHASAQDRPSARASFENPAGETIGTATLTGSPHGVLMALEVSELPADQFLALHFHENGECDPSEGFAAAGGHFNPSGAEHGLLEEAGHHAGDMANQRADATGTIHAQVFNGVVTLGDEGEADLMNRAIIIHANEDDHTADSETGDRIACAVIQ